MTKDMMAKALSDFLTKKDVKTITLSEYKGFGNDVPVKDYLLRRAFGSWSRVLSAMNLRHPVKLTPKPTPAPKKVAPKKVAPKKEKKDVK
jgi:hypothetical protein